MSDWFGLVNLVGLLPLGAAWLVAVRLVFARRSSQGDDVVQRGMTIAGWLLVLVGLMGLLALFVGPVAVFVWPVMLVILSMAVGRFRHNERRSLLWVMALAAERGISLEQAAAAFADERHDETGLRAARLAKELERGVPLPDALRMSGNFLPFDGKLACGIGWQAGCLGPALRSVVDFQEEFDQYLRGAIEKFLYLSILLTGFSLIGSFLFIKVVPVMSMVYADFAIELPRETELLFAVADAATFGQGVRQPLFVPLQYVIDVAYSLVVLAVATLIVGSLLYYLRWITWEPWLVRRLWRRMHTAWILRYLSFLVDQGRPLEDGVRLLAANYPAGYIAHRLYYAAGMLAAGHHWCDALLAQRLIRPTDAGVLRAAQRAGNLSWAMAEMSESNLRRLGLRLRGLLSVAFPLLIVIFGVVIFAVVVSLFLPFPGLIEAILNAE
jgi:type II secretory pathway component PulF